MAIVITTSIGPVELKEGYKEYEAGIDLSRGPFIRKLYLAPDWASAFPAVNGLMGIGGRPVGHKCPESPNLRCLSARLVPEAEIDARDSGRPRFNLPVIEATYGIQMWEGFPEDDPGGNMSFPSEVGPYLFMEHSIAWDIEILKIPNTSYIFSGTGKPIDTPMQVSVGVAEFNIVRHFQGLLPYGNVTAYINKVNNAVFLGQPKGQIKFRKASAKREFTSDGSKTQMVSYTFQWREVPHNQFPKANGRGFDTIQDTSGNGPYAEADLTQLLITTPLP